MNLPLRARLSSFRASHGFAAKLAVLLAIVIVLFAATAIWSLGRLEDSSNQRAAITQRSVEATIHVERLRAAEDFVEATSRGYLLTLNPEFLARLDAADADYDRALEAVASRVDPDRGAALLARVAATTAAYRVERREVLDAALRAAPEELRRGYEQRIVPLRRALSRAIDALAAHEQAELAAGYAAGRAVVSRAAAVTAVVLTSVLIGAALLATTMGRGLAAAYRREAAAVRAAVRALALRDELMGILAHDLRSPLNAITMRTAVLREASPDEASRRQAASIDVIARRMTALIQRLLDASQLEAGQFTVRPGPCAAEELVREAVGLFDDAASARSLELRTRVAEPGILAMVDRDAALQVLTNLIGNAVKFTPAGGAVEVVVAGDPRGVRFSVADTGPGIAPADLTQVFERFWKAEDGGIRGTGLGLYIARGIVEAHGGQIWAESQLGRGSTFHAVFPAAAVAVPTP